MRTVSLKISILFYPFYGLCFDQYTFLLRNEKIQEILSLWDHERLMISLKRYFNEMLKYVYCQYICCHNNEWMHSVMIRTCTSAYSIRESGRCVFFGTIKPLWNWNINEIPSSIWNIISHPLSVLEDHYIQTETDCSLIKRKCFGEISSVGKAMMVASRLEGQFWNKWHEFQPITFRLR